MRDRFGFGWSRYSGRASSVPSQPVSKRPRRRVSQESPDLVHFHTFGRAEGILAQWLSARGTPYFYTYHSASCSCRRADLLRWGKQLCDGQILPLRCLACKINERSRMSPLPAILTARVIAALVPYWLAPWSQAVKNRTELENYQTSFRTFLRDAQAIITHADWIKPLLILNGAQETTIRRIDLGVSAAFHSNQGLKRTKITGSQFTVGFVGRLEPVKGPHILIQAFRTTRYNQARLWIVGDDCRKDRSFEARLRAMAGGDSRIVFRGRSTYGEMPELYSQLSLVAVPSVWYETGPFVVREALAMGIPVATSRTMGDLNLLQKTGMRTVANNTVGAWSEVLNDCFKQHAAGGLDRPSVIVPSASQMFDAIWSEYRRCLRL